MKPDARDVEPGIAIRKFALQLASALLRRFAFEVNRASKPGNPEAIHDLRVSIRRLTQCLRLFARFFPRGEAKRIRRELKALMTQAAQVRNRDIALELLRRAGIRPPAPVLARLAQEREREHRLLVEGLQLWSRRGSFKKWRSQLDL
ncbi:MAG: CHAD domain-containing protein [Bryobacteraceae bacterium]